MELHVKTTFDVLGDGMWRSGKDHEVLGAIDEGTINPHKMKDDVMYLRVEELFGREGFVRGVVASEELYGLKGGRMSCSLRSRKEPEKNLHVLLV